MKKKSIIIILLVCFNVSLYAQKKWTLKECVEYALENNISIKQSELNVNLTDADKLEAIGNFIPSLNLSGSLSENSGLSFNPLTNNAETTTFLAFNGNINVGLTLFDGLRNFRTMQRAKINRLSAQYNLKQMIDDISLSVANNYLQVLLNKANLDVLKTQNEVTVQQIEQTQALVDAGTLPKGDLLEVQATNASEIQSIVAAENQVKISLISLAQLLLIKDYKNFDIDDEGYDIVNTLEGKSVEDLISGAKENRNEIRIAEQNVELAIKDLQIARGAYVPTLSAFFGYNTRFSDATSLGTVTDRSQGPIGQSSTDLVDQNGNPILLNVFPQSLVETAADPFIDQLYENDGIQYGVQLNIPVFNGFAVKANVDRNKINVERSKFLLEQAELDLESNVYQAHVDAEGALKSYEAALTAVESQKLAYEYAKERYDVGLTNAFDFGQAKQRYDNANINLNRAKYDYIFRLKVLELFFGIPATELKF